MGLSGHGHIKISLKALILPEVTSPTLSPVSVSRVSISGHSLDSVGLRSFLRTQVGRTMFNVSQGIRVTGGQCEDRRGCECGTAHLEQEICGHVSGKDYP